MKTVSIVVLLFAVVLASVIAQDEVSSSRNAAVAQCPLRCQLGISFNYPHLLSCNQYLRCSNGRLLQFDCGHHEVFDVESLTCRRNGRCFIPV